MYYCSNKNVFLTNLHLKCGLFIKYLVRAILLFSDMKGHLRKGPDPFFRDSPSQKCSQRQENVRYIHKVDIFIGVFYVYDISFSSWYICILPALSSTRPLIPCEFFRIFSCCNLRFPDILLRRLAGKVRQDVWSKWFRHLRSHIQPLLKISGLPYMHTGGNLGSPHI